MVPTIKSGLVALTPRVDRLERENRRFDGIRAFILVGIAGVVLIGVGVPSREAAPATGREPVANAVLMLLRNQFMLDDIVELLEKRHSRPQVRQYLLERPTVYRFDGSGRQHQMAMDAYRVRTPSIIGMTLFFLDEDGELFLTNLVIHPDAQRHALWLKVRSLASVDAPGQAPSLGGKLYFLGAYNLSASTAVRLMLREDRMPSGVTIYSLNYLVSRDE